MSSSDIETVRLIVRDELAKNGNGIEHDEDPHITLRKNLPSGVNYAKCEGADCGHVKLKNPNQTTKHKACPECKNNNVPKNSDFCPNCGLEEESKKFEQWEDSDI